MHINYPFPLPLGIYSYEYSKGGSPVHIQVYF